MATTRLSLLVLTLGAACALSAPALPSCAPFATKGGQPVECTVELVAGYTYVIYTDCARVKGDTQLTLRDPNGVDVAFNDGFPFCPGDTGASLLEFYVECDLYGASAKFSLLQDCFEDTECGGSVVVEYSSKEEPVDCKRGPFVCTKQDATCEALGDLYYATNGSGWTNNSGWADAAAGKATDYCNFYPGMSSGGATAGVPCTSDGDFTALVVWVNNLVGTFPLSLGNLRLTSIDIGGNDFLGTGLPDTIGSLSALTNLQIDFANLGGSLPSSIGSLTLLERIDLEQNVLRGTLPESLGSLTQLRDLQLYNNPVDAPGNFITGSIPESFGNLVAIQDFYLGGNGLSGAIPRSLVNIASPFTLDLTSNAFSGTLPDWLGSLTQVGSLNFGRNSFVGTVPASYSSLAALFALDLSNNTLEGSLPSSFSSLTSIRYLLLAGSGLCGPVPMPHQPDDGQLPDCPRDGSAVEPVLKTTHAI